LELAAHEGLVDSELATGHHADVVADLVALVARYPMRERFRAQLIIALYRSGRQVDALQTQREARTYLLDELGLDPGIELQALERAVLAHDPALAAPIPLKRIAAAPGIPTPLTSFVGRHRELTLLEEAVTRSRLTSVVGPGGVGKSRLVLELIRRGLLDCDEVWFVELAPVTPTGVSDAVAVGVGALERAPLGGQPALTPVQRAIERLGRRDVVVILDSCEHVAAAASTCAMALLAACPGLRLVTTSRVSIGIPGEHQIALGPLDLEESAELFVARARAVQPLFTTGAETDEELIELCRHLDGLPLAIELAAARTKILPVPEIADRLRNRFELLRRTERAGPSRHEGLEAAIDWSYELLFDDERRTFRRLAVFTGGATIEAAECLCGPDALDVASRLVDRSLLVADTSGRTVRFDMLESLRAYGVERLAACGELAATRSDHLQWYIHLVERVDREVRGANQLEWLARLDNEHDNVRAALRHAVEHDPAGALRLVGGVVLPWWFRGRLQETRHWVETSLAAGSDQSPILRARLLAACGLLAEPNKPAVGEETGNELHFSLITAEARQREAIAIYLAEGSEWDTATARLMLLSTLARRASAGEAIDHDEVDALVNASSTVFDRLGDDHSSAIVRVTDAIAAVVFGDVARAESSIVAAMPFARRSGDRFAASRIEYVLGILDELSYDPKAAYRHIERSLRLLDELGMHQAVTSQARLLAPLAARCGEPELAAQWRAFVSGRGDAWTHYDGTVLASARNHEGLHARAAGDLGRATDAHTAALEWYATAGIPSGVAFTESCLGFLAAGRGDHAESASHHTAALVAATTSPDPAALALALEGRATELDDPVARAILLGAAGSLWDATMPSTVPTHRRDVGAAADEARRAIGAEAFTLAFAEGAALDRRAALTFARRSV
jgi:predicted ATPase